MYVGFAPSRVCAGLWYWYELVVKVSVGCVDDVALCVASWNGSSPQEQKGDGVPLAMAKV